MTVTTKFQYDPRGSFWYRWDLHLHTPASFDYHNKGVTNQQLVDQLTKNGVRVVAITDHHVMDVDRIKELQRLGGEQLTVLPGIELRDDHGGDPIHYICIFSEDCDLGHVWTTLQGKLQLTPTAIASKGGDQKVYVPIEDGAKVTRELQGVVSIHAGEKTNSIESINNKEQFQQRIKYDITNQWVDLMEIGQIKDIDRHHKRIFPATGLNKPLVICSDNHNIIDYSVKSPLWFRAEPCFRGLLMVLREPQDRVEICDRPEGLVRIERNPTKHIKSVAFHQRPNTVLNAKWFDGDIVFNPGLIAIIGNKGSGKSALADIIGLLGATKNASSFSFLCKERFCHPVNGQADHYDATLVWDSGKPVTKCLKDSIKAEEPENVKYLPQSFVEQVCNEIVGIDEEGFERELQSVIFSHVPEPQRLGHSTLDALVRFQTSEKQNRIDSLLKNLREVSRERSILELQSEPQVKNQILEKIKLRESELVTHDKMKPEEQADPSKRGQLTDEEKEFLTKLKDQESEKKQIEDLVLLSTETLRNNERRRAISLRVLEKLSNFEKEFLAFKNSLSEDAFEIGLSTDSLVSLKVEANDAIVVKDNATKIIDAEAQRINGPLPDGLNQRLTLLNKEIVDLRAQLDAPNRIYQAYLKDMQDWEQQRKNIIGNANVPESLEWLHIELAKFDSLPQQIEELRSEQIRLALEIHTEKLSQAEVYSTHYGAVQQFIDSHELAKHKLGLEFRVELANEGFSGRFLEMLALNRRGSFMGVDEGRAVADNLAEVTDWADPDSLARFLNGVDNALHFDMRTKPNTQTYVRDQLVKDKKPEELFELVYGLGYIRPRYVLRWDKKDISLLSPGERGTLLLVFYLLIDRGDVPLIIDQPEGNLDNHTVAKVLVDAIKSARKRRQVIIVTHNPNIAVVCDADQVIHASMDKTKGNAITYISGSLENPQINQFVTDVLEGTRWAFKKRSDKYDVAESA